MPFGTFTTLVVWLLFWPIDISQRPSMVRYQSLLRKCGVKVSVWRVVMACEL